MARYNTGSGSIAQPSDRYHSDSPDMIGAQSDGSAAQTAEAIKDRVKRSYIYQTCYEIFSNEQDKYWLTQLNGIIDSIIGASQTFWDETGLSNASSDKNEAIYNEAINNIQSLYNQYQSYKNSLPSTQVQQFADAGINSAITGNGVNGSSLDQRDISSSASSMPSTNSGDYVSQVANFALSASQGLTSTLKSVADTILSFRGQSLQREQFEESKRQFGITSSESFAKFKAEMADKGVILKSSNWSDLDTKDPNWNDNASSQAKSMYNDWQLLDNTYKYGPELSAFGNVDSDLQDDFLDIGHMQLSLRLGEIVHHAKRREIQMPLELTEDSLKEYENAKKKNEAELQAYKSQVYLNRMKTLAKKAKDGNIVAEVQLINMLDNADWQESLLYVLSDGLDWKSVNSLRDDVIKGINNVLDFIELPSDRTKKGLKFLNFGDSDDTPSDDDPSFGDFVFGTSAIGYPINMLRKWLNKSDK